jgi:hypothetical protein
MAGLVGFGDAAAHAPVMNRQPLAVHAVRILARSKLGTGSVVPLPGIVRPETGGRPGRVNWTIRRSVPDERSSTSAWRPVALVSRGVAGE